MIKDPSIVSRKQKLNNFLCNKRILKKKLKENLMKQCLLFLQKILEKTKGHCFRNIFFLHFVFVIVLCHVTTRQSDVFEIFGKKS